MQLPRSGSSTSDAIGHHHFGALSHGLTRSSMMTAAALRTRVQMWKATRMSL
jgi:hypothetical protein